MKMKRFLTLLLAVMLIIALFAGCAKSPVANGDYIAGGVESVKPSPESGLGSSTVLNPGVADDRKLIRTVNLTTETEDMDALLTQISSRIAELGGYVESREIYSGSAYANYRTRNATMTIRIPAENLDTFVTHVDGASHIISFKESADDVTMQYVATESHLKVLQEQELIQGLQSACSRQPDWKSYNSQIIKQSTQKDSASVVGAELALD